MALRDKFLVEAAKLQRREPANSQELLAVVGEPFFVSELSAQDAGDFTASRVDIVYDENDDIKSRRLNFRNLKARLLVKALTDASGARIFTDAEADELGRLP